MVRDTSRSNFTHCALRVCSVLVFALASTASFSESLFQTAELLKIKLTGNVRKLVRDDKTERDWHNFQLQVGDDSLDVKLRVRGNFRRKECEFPPIMIKFKSSQVKQTVFAGQKKLKLVTHCNEKRSFSINTYEEYIAYKLLNQVTDKSFKVRLLEVTYGAEGKKVKVRPAFFIEHVNSLAERLGGTHIEPEFVRSKRLDQHYMVQASIFQYWIGNTDFSFIAPIKGAACCHNSKLIQVGHDIYSVPYDFDFSGLVDAAYAGSNPLVKTKTVRRRQYRGFCTDPKTLSTALAEFPGLESKLDDVFDSATGLSAREAGRGKRYLQKFFKTIQEKGQGVFEESCRKTRTG